MSYWSKRLQQIAHNQEKRSKTVDRKLQKLYKEALKQIEIDVSDLYIKMLEEGEISPLTAYKMGRYRSFQEQMNKSIKDLGGKEKELLQMTLMDAYINTVRDTGEAVNMAISDLVMNSQMRKAMEEGWLGSNYSTRLWANKEKLFSALDKMLVQSIALGKSKDEIIKHIMRVMGSGFADTDRLVRTEMMFIINQAQKDTYVNAGFEEYEFMAALDERTSKKCEELDGEIFNFNKASVGINYPPVHPRCRSTVVPVMNKNI